METRNRILEESAKLFAKNGYAGTSVREIASKVGIKDSSLYFHFKNKQAMMDALKDKFIEISLRSIAMLGQGIQGITVMNHQIFMNVTIGYLKGYFMEPFINAFLRILLHEQSNNPEYRELYLEWCLRKPIGFQMQMIQGLQEMGFLKKMDSLFLTEQYYAPLFVYFQEYLISDEMEHSKDEILLKKAQNHVMEYLKEFGVK